MVSAFQRARRVATSPGNTCPSKAEPMQKPPRLTFEGLPEARARLTGASHHFEGAPACASLHKDAIRFGK